MTPISRQWANPAIRFFRIKQEWEEATAMLSSITEKIAMHPAYQQIIGMGPIAIPFIMRELENRPAHWFWANQSPGKIPVPPDKRGRIGDMAKAWLIWGREHDYIK